MLYTSSGGTILQKGIPTDLSYLVILAQTSWVVSIEVFGKGQSNRQCI